MRPSAVGNIHSASKVSIQGPLFFLDPEFRPGMNIVSDLSDAEFDFGYSEMQALVSKVAEKSQDTQISINRDA